jgi:hypothetical protein
VGCARVVCVGWGLALVAVPAGASEVSAGAGGAAAFGGTDAVPVTERPGDSDRPVVPRPLPAGTGGGTVDVGSGVFPAPSDGRSGFPPKTVAVTATVITSTATAVTAAAVRTGPEGVPRLAGPRARCRGPGRAMPGVTASRAEPAERR